MALKRFSNPSWVKLLIPVVGSCYCTDRYFTYRIKMSENRVSNSYTTTTNCVNSTSDINTITTSFTNNTGTTIIKKESTGTRGNGDNIITNFSLSVNCDGVGYYIIDSRKYIIGKGTYSVIPGSCKEVTRKN